MKKSVPFGISVAVLVILAVLVVFPASGMVYPLPTTSLSATNSTVPGAPGITTNLSVKHVVGARISSVSPAIGEPVTINGLVTGSILPVDVQIWLFAGNYVNVSTVPVNADGTISITYSTIGLPPAIYYVYIQSPGANGKFNIDLEEAGINSGQVVNTVTNALIFNITGAGSVRDAAASQALSDAINNQGVDDAYTKLTLQLVAPDTTPVTEQITTGALTSATTPAKSPLTLEITGLALVVGGLGIVMCVRKRR
jgi:hypothetical protein